jgi:hypothetical protein
VLKRRRSINTLGGKLKRRELSKINFKMSSYVKTRKRLQHLVDIQHQREEFSFERSNRQSVRDRLSQMLPIDQSGGAVMTRRQAREVPQVPPPLEIVDDGSDEIPEIASVGPGEETTGMDVEEENSADNEKRELDAIASAEKMDVDIDSQNSSGKTKNEDHLFNQETLIASNDFVEVFVVKTLFKRQKLFSFDDHQVEKINKSISKLCTSIMGSCLDAPRGGRGEEGGTSRTRSVLNFFFTRTRKKH